MLPSCDVLRDSHLILWRSKEVRGMHIRRPELLLSRPRLRSRTRAKELYSTNQPSTGVMGAVGGRGSTVAKLRERV